MMKRDSGGTRPRQGTRALAWAALPVLGCAVTVFAQTAAPESRTPVTDTVEHAAKVAGRKVIAVSRAAESAGRLLATGTQTAGNGGVAPAVFRVAIERSLLPVFGILGVLAVVNLFVTERFPADAELPAEAAAETELPG